MGDAVVHIHNINGKELVDMSGGVKVMINCFYVLEEVDSILAPVGPTVKWDQRVKDTIQPIGRSGGGTIDRRNNTPKGGQTVTIQSFFVDFGEAIEMRANSIPHSDAKG